MNRSMSLGLVLLLPCLTVGQDNSTFDPTRTRPSTQGMDFVIGTVESVTIPYLTVSLPVGYERLFVTHEDCYITRDGKPCCLADARQPYRAKLYFYADTDPNDSAPGWVVYVIELTKREPPPRWVKAGPPAGQ